MSEPFVNGNLRAVLITLGKWALGILSALIILVMGAGATSSIQSRVDIGVLMTDMEHVKGAQERHEESMSDLSDEISDLDSKLDAHIQQTVINRKIDGGGNE